MYVYINVLLYFTFEPSAVTPQQPEIKNKNMIKYHTLRKVSTLNGHPVALPTSSSLTPSATSTSVNPLLGSTSNTACSCNKTL